MQLFGHDTSSVRYKHAGNVVLRYNGLTMLRKMLIVLGLLIAVLPYSGFPHSWQTVISTGAGLLIVAFIFLSRHHKVHREVSETVEETPRALHVERMEVEDRPHMHVERETIVDTATVDEEADTETTVEKKVTIMRRRRQKSEGDGLSDEHPL